MRDKIIDEIKAERERQVNHEGFSLAHDDQYKDGELALAASTYALPPKKRTLWTPNCDHAPMFWPFAPEWYKPRVDSRRRELIMAAALLVAEIERIDREDDRKRKLEEGNKDFNEKLHKFFAAIPDDEFVQLVREIALLKDETIPEENSSLAIACAKAEKALGGKVDTEVVRHIVEREAMARWLMKIG